jgi:hypothetical protein
VHQSSYPILEISTQNTLARALWQHSLCLRDLCQVAIQLVGCEEARSDFALRSPPGISIHIGNVLALQSNMKLLVLWPGGIYRASLVNQIVYRFSAIQHYHRALPYLEGVHLSKLFTPIFESRNRWLPVETSLRRIVY